MPFHFQTHAWQRVWKQQGQVTPDCKQPIPAGVLLFKVNRHKGPGRKLQQISSHGRKRTCWHSATPAIVPMVSHWQPEGNRKWQSMAQPDQRIT